MHDKSSRAPSQQPAFSMSISGESAADCTPCRGSQARWLAPPPLSPRPPPPKRTSSSPPHRALLPSHLTISTTPCLSYQHPLPPRPAPPGPPITLVAAAPDRFRSRPPWPPAGPSPLPSARSSTRNAAQRAPPATRGRARRRVRIGGRAHESAAGAAGVVSLGVEGETETRCIPPSPTPPSPPKKKLDPHSTSQLREKAGRWQPIRYLCQTLSILLHRWRSRHPSTDMHPLNLSLTGLPTGGQALLCHRSPCTI